jgi:hypothetical protein
LLRVPGKKFRLISGWRTWLIIALGMLEGAVILVFVTMGTENGHCIFL